MIGPWILLLIYDVFLFLFRTTLYDFPIIGGRARNRPRPRAPSLRNRPGGRPRSLSFPLPGITAAPTSPVWKMSSGLDEKYGNGSAVYRSKSSNLPKDIPEETRAMLQAFSEKHSQEDLEQIDGTAIASETGLTTCKFCLHFSIYEKYAIVSFKMIKNFRM